MRHPAPSPRPAFAILVGHQPRTPTFRGLGRRVPYGRVEQLQVPGLGFDTFASNRGRANVCCWRKRTLDLLLAV